MIKNNITFFIILVLCLNCRPGSEKGRCKEKLSHTQDASLCGGGFAIAALGLTDIIGNSTQDQESALINGILIECLRLQKEQEKCKDASSYQPTIY